jgi:hypothetical protein
MLWKNVMLTFACVACCVAGNAPAARADVTCLPPVQVVEMVGKLQYIISDAITHERLFVCDTLPQPFCKSWSVQKGLTVRGTTYGLLIPANLGNRIEQLMGKEVVLSGDLLLDKLSVREVKPHEPGSIKRTVHVEIRGTLHWNRGLRCLSPEFEVVAGGICSEACAYALDFGANRELRTLAQSLDGQTVIVHGVQQEAGINAPSILVSSLQKGDLTYVRETIAVEIHGTLRRLPGEGKSIPPMISWQVEVDGTAYPLQLTTADMRKWATLLEGGRVVIRGTLKGGVVTVTELQAAVLALEDHEKDIPIAR